ncbi:MAG: hypothetical protein QNJ64_00635 [Crocosphaera sp.]|nr:hypothetical protein [Crocosphaera sp.]
MLTQFRKHYPKGSLISELLTIDHGKYIVRVLLENNGVTLGTGLAADYKIEIAEDRAIERALNHLQLDSHSLEFSPKSVSQSPPHSQEVTHPMKTKKVTASPAAKNVKPVATKEILKEPEIDPLPVAEIASETSNQSSQKRVKTSTNTKKAKSIEPEIEEKPLPIPETPQALEIEEKPLPIPETPQALEIEEKPLPIPETPQAPEIEEKPLPIPETPQALETEEKPLPITETPQAPEEEELLDFSEIIARSNAELKRLQWTTEQGRQYLIKTYGKRSRQVLSDEELLEFLRYLESLPTPS